MTGRTIEDIRANTINECRFCTIDEENNEKCLICTWSKI